MCERERLRLVGRHKYCRELRAHGFLCTSFVAASCLIMPHASAQDGAHHLCSGPTHIDRSIALSSYPSGWWCRCHPRRARGPPDPPTRTPWTRASQRFPWADAPAFASTTRAKHRNVGQTLKSLAETKQTTRQNIFARGGSIRVYRRSLSRVSAGGALHLLEPGRWIASRPFPKAASASGRRGHLLGSLRSCWSAPPSAPFRGGAEVVWGGRKSEERMTR